MMSYPTPWIVDYDGDVIDADGDIVIEGRAANWDLRIKLDDLVSRINAGAEAEARAERAEKALDDAADTMQIAVIDDSSEVNGQYVTDGHRYKGKEVIIAVGYGETFVHGLTSCHPELTAYLKEKEKK